LDWYTDGIFRPREFIIHIYFYKNEVNYVPPKFADLLFKLPNLEKFTLDVQHANATQLLDNFRFIIDTNQAIEESKKATSSTVEHSGTNGPKGDVQILSSLRSLTIQDENFQFIGRLCPNIQDLTVKQRSIVRSSSPPDDEQVTALGLIITSIRETHPHLKRLHFAESCEQPVLEGTFNISQPPLTDQHYPL
jgi:hypothetical protein